MTPRISNLSWSRRWLFAAAIFVLGLAAACETAGPDRGGSLEILVVAIDGLEPTLVDRFIAEGRLPVLESLIAKGSRARIASEGQMLSPIIWTTVATGVSKDRHGIVHWRIDDIPITSAMRKVPAFWNTLAANGIRSAVLGWLATWPAEDDSGFVLSDRADARIEDQLQAPAGHLDLERFVVKQSESELLARFADWTYDPNFRERPKTDPLYAPNFLLEQRLVKILQRDAFFLSASEALLDRGDLDLLAVYLRGLDYVGHGFWQYFEPEAFEAAGRAVNREHARALGSVIPAYYSWIDRRLGELVRRAGPQASVVVLSDHGFGASLPPNEMVALKAEFLTGSHRRRGDLIVSGPLFRKGVEPYQVVRHLDVMPTLYYLLGIPISRELEGAVQLRYLSEGALTRRPVYVDTYGGNRSVRVEGGKSDAEIVRDLESLGYLQ